MARSDPVVRSSRFVMLASICVIVAALYLAQEVLIPLACAMLLSFLLAPLVRRLERMRVPRVPSVIIVMLLALGLIAGIGYIVWNQLISLSANLPAYEKNIAAKIERVRPSGTGVIGRWRKAAEDLNKAVSDPATTRATTQATATGPTPGSTEVT